MNPGRYLAVGFGLGILMLLMLHLRLETRVRRDEFGPAEFDEKYISYMPHSGLHNQRIALINAAMIALALNRTLIMPELNLGFATYWRPSIPLAHRLDDCVGQSLHALQTKERGKWYLPNCTDYKNYLPMAVDSIFDLRILEQMGIKTIQRRHMQLDYFARYWGIPQDSRNQSMVHQIPDRTRYSVQVLDKPDADRKNIRYERTITFGELAQHHEPFLLFNSLFGSSRLALSDSRWVRAREQMRQEIGLRQPHVMNASLDVVSKLGGPGNFVSAHIRMGDGAFKQLMNETMEQVRNKLIHLSNDDALNQTTLASVVALRGRPADRLARCLQLQPPRHHRFGLIYVSTDAPDPHNTLAHLYDEFACLFSLQDFGDVAKTTIAMDLPLFAPRIPHKDDSPPVITTKGSVLLPLIDAEIASLGSHFVPTPKSTFSSYITNRNKRFQRLYDPSS
ncbi:hypothetical protein BC940DRAFT_304698 [Gongronella butleri]|nr:hypothetical protein BC940DRAFT_304698 [Gongronella butleri]